MDAIVYDDVPMLKVEDMPRLQEGCSYSTSRLKLGFSDGWSLIDMGVQIHIN